MKAYLYLKTGILFLFVLITSLLKAQVSNAEFDKSAFYNAMAGKDSKEVKAQLEILEKISIKEKEAFEGALLMKKAGLTGDPKNKLSTFKSGYKKLEAAISKDRRNAELRFLRLIIQENAPKFLKYHNEIEQDSGFIRENIQTLDSVAQQAVMDYNKKSKVLNL